METFRQTFGFIAAVCTGIILLTLFFYAVGYIARLGQSPPAGKMKGFLKDAKLVNVHLGGGKTLERMRLVGFTDESMKGGHIPYQLAHMLVLETERGARVLVRADSVRMIEEVEGVA